MNNRRHLRIDELKVKKIQKKSAGNPATRNQKTARRKFRRKLEEWGMDPAEVSLCVEQYRQNQMAKTNGKLAIDAPLCTRASYVNLLRKYSTNPENPALNLGNDYDPNMDDSGYKPTRVDSTLVGAARATGKAAQSIKRGKALTKYQYDQES